MRIYALREMGKERYDEMKHRSSRNIMNDEIFEKVKAIADDVIKYGDRAVAENTKKYDNVQLSPDTLLVREEEFESAWANTSDEVKESIKIAVENAAKYNTCIKPPEMETYAISDGILAGRKTSPLNRAALYVPCGKGSYPSSFITIAIPAVVAGVKEIVAIVPPKADGAVDAAVLVAAKILGISTVYRGNGPSIIFAAAFGTDLLPKAEKIIGPGSEYIMAAQMYAQLKGVSIGLFYGPSECMIIADDTANPALIAADLINEAEHGMNSSAILITDSEEIAASVQKLVDIQIERLPEWRKKYAESALTLYGGIVVVDNMDEAVVLANDWGNEHIQVATKNSWDVAKRINGASELLIGQYSTFSAISYAAGVPACLPTGQFSKIHSGVTVDTFLKVSAITELNKTGLQTLADPIKTLSKYEGFPGLTNSIIIRQENGIISR